MKFSIAVASCLAGLSSGLSIPRGTGGSIIQIPNSNEFRVYYQDYDSKIWEGTVGLPTSKVINTGVVATGPTRRNTPIASLSWQDSEGIKIRTYYITPKSTLGEVAFDVNQWNGGRDLGIAIQPDSQLLYATYTKSHLLVGFTNPDGQLSEAYWDFGAPGWRTYVL